MKKFVTKHQKFISGLLLTLIAIGSVASLFAVFYPFLGLMAWQLVDGTPEEPSLANGFIKLVLSITPVVPWTLLLGGISAILYTFVARSFENKVFLRVWGTILLLLFIMFALPYINAYLR